MSTDNLEATVQALLAPGKGILAADETVGTISKRFEAQGINSTEETRRELWGDAVQYTRPRFVSGFIMYDEAIGGGHPVCVAKGCSSKRHRFVTSSQQFRNNQPL